MQVLGAYLSKEQFIVMKYILNGDYIENYPHKYLSIYILAMEAAHHHFICTSAHYFTFVH